MFPRILNLIQTHKRPPNPRPPRQSPLSLLHLTLAPPFLNRQRKLRIYKLQPELAALVGLLECVHGAEFKVHGVGVREVFEEGEELGDVVLGHDLQADRGGGPLFVDGDYHAPAGDGEGGCDSEHVNIVFITCGFWILTRQT